MQKEGATSLGQGSHARFKLFAIYATQSFASAAFILVGVRMMGGRFQATFPDLSARYLVTRVKREHDDPPVSIVAQTNEE